MASHQGGRQPAGIRDVARAAGVSVASASFALNGQPAVAEDTRKRILAAAEKLGYRANTQAQAVSLALSSDGESGPLTGTVIAVTFLGATSRVNVDLGDATIMAQLPTADASALRAGSRVTLAIRPDPVLVSGAAPAAAAE